MADRRTSLDLWTAVILVAVAVFQCWAACAFTVYDDEAFSCRRYAMPMGDMLSALRQGVEPDPPLYYVAQNVWVHLFGVGPLALRSVSILFFLLGLVAIRMAAQAWFDRSTGLAAMVLCACHPAHLFFGLAARWYSLMFLCVALLLWLTARVSAGERRSGAPVFAWAIVAALTCYTNYFGPVVVALLWFVGVARTWGRPGMGGRWLLAGVGAGLLFIPWMGPFGRQVAHFPRPDAGIASFLATAAKTILALLTGNLASPASWWVWVPMALFAMGLILLLVRRWAVVWPIAIVVLGCFIVGILSRTMMDKYIMIFSGIACVLAAALLLHQIGPGVSRRTVTIAEFTFIALIVGGIGCGVSFLTKTHWSSLRWLDPFESVVADLYEDTSSLDNEKDGIAAGGLIVASHPSVRYYAVCEEVQKESGKPTLSAAAWLRALDAQDKPPTADRTGYLATVTPTVATACASADILTIRITTIETAGFASLPDWDALLEVLNREWVVTEESHYLEDLAAAWKDRLDPGVRHPKWRITVRSWGREPVE